MAPIVCQRTRFGVSGLQREIKQIVNLTMEKSGVSVQDLNISRVDN